MSIDKDLESDLLKILEDNPANLEALTEMCSMMTLKSDYPLALHYGKKLLETAQDKDDLAYVIRGYAYAGQSFIGVEKYDSANIYLNRGLELWLNHKDNLLKNIKIRQIANIYNCLGINAIVIEGDYYQGIAYFHEAIAHAKDCGEERDYIWLATNLVRSCYVVNDPSGLEYALEVYRYGHKHGNETIIFTGSLSSALMFYLIQDYEEALPYIEECVSMVDKYFYHVGVYNLYGNILNKLGRTDEAETYYLKALEYTHTHSKTDEATYAFLSYGEFLLEKGMYEKAIGYLEKGIDLSKNKSHSIYRYKLYENLSKAYAQIEDYGKALDYYRSFHYETDSIYNVERERGIQQLKTKYEEEKNGTDAGITYRWKVVRTVLWSIGVLIVMAAAYLAYRRFRRKEEPDDSEPKDISLEKYSVSSLTDEKGKELFTRLEKLMKEERIYREANLTKERVAEMINTNRTYLSQVINEQTGLSFNHYINSYRIDEAVRILSDPDDNTPLKALCFDLGFQSLSTFYRIFKSKEGMTPMEFRQRITAVHD